MWNGKTQRKLPMSIATLFSYKQFVFLCGISVPVWQLKWKQIDSCSSACLHWKRNEKWHFVYLLRLHAVMQMDHVAHAPCISPNWRMCQRKSASFCISLNRPISHNPGHLVLSYQAFDTNSLQMEVFQFQSIPCDAVAPRKNTPIHTSKARHHHPNPCICN